MGQRAGPDPFRTPAPGSDIQRDAVSMAGTAVSQLTRITIFAGDFEDTPSADYRWVSAWLARWKAALRVADYSTGGSEHIWNIEAPEEAIAEVPDHLFCASEWSGWTVPRK